MVDTASEGGPEKHHVVARLLRRVLVGVGSVLILAGAIWRSIILFGRQLTTESVLKFLTVGVVLAFLVVVLWKLPKWQVAHSVGVTLENEFDRENEARKTLAQIIGGLIILLGAYATWQTMRVSQDSLRVAQEGQITDRFARAVELLGATDTAGTEKLETRIGGIYALERIARDSERDHTTVMEIFSAYVRENSPSEHVAPRNLGVEAETQGTGIPPQGLRSDIQAILTVIGRREYGYEGPKTMYDAFRHSPRTLLDLSSTNLEGVWLYMANLSKLNLRKANLRRTTLLFSNFREAALFEADLSGAYIYETDLGGADLRNASLRGAELVSVNFDDAYLDSADFGGANVKMVGFDRAHLIKTNLRGVDLRGTFGLTQEQINDTVGDKSTLLPGGLRMPAHWDE